MIVAARRARGGRETVRNTVDDARTRLVDREAGRAVT